MLTYINRLHISENNNINNFNNLIMSIIKGKVFFFHFGGYGYLTLPNPIT